jgi:NDP-sugar pyrophosphorylase family protein
MKCRNQKCINSTKGRVFRTEISTDDDMFTVIYECDECGWSGTYWYDFDDIEDLIPCNDSWIDENEKEVKIR